MSRSLKAFIAASVLLNLLLAGIVIGNAGRYAMGSRMRHTLQEMAATLPEDKRAHFEETLQRVQKDTDALRQQLSDARKKAVNLLKAPSFNKEAYLAQMQEVQRLHAQIMQRMVESVAQLAEQESPDERVTLADMLRHPPRASSDD